MLWLRLHELEDLISLHRMDVFVALCSEEIPACNNFVNYWMDASLIYTTDLLVFASMDVDEAKDFIEIYHVTKYPYLRFFPRCKGEDSYRYEGKFQAVSINKFIETKTGLPCDDEDDEL